MFIEVYGVEVGNLVLKFLFYSGLYIVGGIVVKIILFINLGSFMEVFKDKGWMKFLLEKIFVYVILNFYVGLIGVVICVFNL